MALDPTFREANVRDSIIKYFVDNLRRSERIGITFDTSLTPPKIQGIVVDRWVVVDLGGMIPDAVAQVDLRIICCTTQDNEGHKLANLRDIVCGYLTNKDQSDGRRRITLYRMIPQQTPIEIGTMLVLLGMSSRELKSSNETKFRIVQATLKWGAKI